MEYGHLNEADKFQIVPNALSYNEYITDEGIAKKRPVALIVSRLDDPPKRISLALRIWKQVVMPYAKDKRFADRIIRLQNISNEELKYLYEHADLFVTTSLHEGFGYTPIEAAVCGCPVISSTCEALPDTPQGLLNYYEPAMDEQALSNRIAEVLSRQPSEEKLLHICETFKSMYVPEGQSLSILQVIWQYLKLYTIAGLEEILYQN